MQSQKRVFRIRARSSTDEWCVRLEGRKEAVEVSSVFSQIAQSAPRRARPAARRPLTTSVSLEIVVQVVVGLTRDYADCMHACATRCCATVADRGMGLSIAPDASSTSELELRPRLPPDRPPPWSAPPASPPSPARSVMNPGPARRDLDAHARTQRSSLSTQTSLLPCLLTFSKPRRLRQPTSPDQLSHPSALPDHAT